MPARCPSTVCTISSISKRLAISTLTVRAWGMFIWARGDGRGTVARPADGRQDTAPPSLAGAPRGAMLRSRPVRIRTADHFRGRFTVPGDKAISHRLAILGALAEGETRIENFGSAADCAST